MGKRRRLSSSSKVRPIRSGVPRGKRIINGWRRFCITGIRSLPRSLSLSQIPGRNVERKLQEKYGSTRGMHASVREISANKTTEDKPIRAHDLSE
jgi:hypothetical protein